MTDDQATDEQKIEPIAPEMEKHGGPAYPLSFTVDGVVIFEPGMSLRDWFAGQALPRMMAENLRMIRAAAESGIDPPDVSEKTMAWDSYEIADAMIAHRKQ